MISFKKIIPVLMSLLILAGSGPAQASTECQSAVQKIWAGDGGYVWIYMQNGGAAMIAPNDPSREAAISLATSALLASRQVVIRFAADGVNCAAGGRTDFVGIFLL